MKKKILLLMLLILAFTLCACGGQKEEKTEEEPENKSVVFEFGDIAVTKGEVYIYVNTVKEKYEEEFGEDVWETKLAADENETQTMEELTRQAIIEEIVRVKTFASHAEEYNVRLSETDENTIAEKAHEFYSKLTDKDIESMEITEELAYTVMKENLLQVRVREAVLESESVEISDEDARMTCFYDMYFPCFTLNAGGYVIPFSDEEKEEQYQMAVEACSTLATAALGEDETAQSIEKLSESYGLTEAKERTMSPDDIKETYGEDIYNEIYGMKDGQYSTVLESEYGYHVFEMIELTAEDATAERKAAMTEEAVEKLIEGKEEAWENEIDAGFSYPTSVNMDIYNEIKIEG